MSRSSKRLAIHRYENVHRVSHAFEILSSRSRTESPPLAGESLAQLMATLQGMRIWGHGPRSRTSSITYPPMGRLHRQLPVFWTRG